MNTKKVSLMTAGVFLALWAGAATVVESPAVNTLGYTEIDSRRAYLPIAISYDEAAVRSGVDTSVADVVLTAPLAVDDELFVYNRKTRNYDAYTLRTNATETAKEWVASPTKNISLGGVTEQTAAAAEQTAVTKGYGLWLHRLGESTNSVVQVMGQLAKTISVSVPPCSSVLLCVPSEFDAQGLDLNADGSPFKGKAAKNDLVEVPQEDGKLAIYRFNGTSWTAAKRGGTLEKVPTGSAFWYVRKGETTLEVTWEF